jgi:hypothetical protein
MLANVGFRPPGVVAMGICNAVSKTASLLGFLPIVSVERVALASLSSSTGRDVAEVGVHAVDFGVVDGFVTGPIPPMAPILVTITHSVVGAALHASDMSTRVFSGIGG